MRRFARIALPIVSVLMLAAAAALILENPHDFRGVHRAGTQPVAKDPTLLASVGTAPAPADLAGASQTGATPASAAQPAAASVLLAQAQSGDTSGGAAAGAALPVSRARESVILASGIVSTPRPAHPYFLEQIGASGGLEYGITRNEGLFVSVDGGATWEERSNGLPLRIIYPFTNDPIATLTSLGVDPLDGKRVAVTTSSSIYLSDDAGLSWNEIPVHDPIKSSTYFTSIALSPFDPATIAVGTSFSGIFVTTDAGKSWNHQTNDIGSLYQGAGFYEEISGLAYSPTEAGVLFMGVGFGGGVFRLDPGGSLPATLDFPGAKEQQVIRSLSFRPAPDPAGKPSWKIDLATNRDIWSYEPAAAVWKVVRAAIPDPAPSPAKQARMASAADRAGIYLSPVDASGARLAHWIAFLKANGLNTLVVDVKDDFGRITYNSQVPFAWKIGAVHPFFNMEDLIRTAHENGIYVVGRFVVFKDPMLFRYDNNKYAIWDPQRNAPWGHFVKEEVDGKVKWVQKEFWVDPFSETVWRYNISIAEELQRLGIDEIQFDYIRFPSEVTSTNALYRFRRPGMTRDDALESFLVMAREALKIPISVDLFGYNSWYPIAGWVGQNINMYSNYADVVCPMFYPSLFPLDFLPQLSYLDRAKYLYRNGTWRSKRIVAGRAIIRPFVQSFLLLPNELAMDKAQYSDYLRRELEGAQEAHSSGFTLWNFGTNYYMVTFPLTPYVPPREDVLDPASPQLGLGASEAHQAADPKSSP